VLLHTVNKSPFERNSLESCLRLAADGSAILLIEDGVYGALDNTAVSDLIKKRMDNIKFYALGPDLEARGLANSPLIPGVETVDYGGFVDLAEKHSATQSWL
jgi:tRNA 2-thiouridine synthesizing protein B